MYKKYQNSGIKLNKINFIKNNFFIIKLIYIFYEKV